MKKSKSHTLRNFVLLALAAFLVGVATPAGLLAWQVASKTVVMLQGPAGRLVSTRIDRGIFPVDTLTRVDTSTGSVLIQGPYSGIRGSPLVVEKLNKLPAMQLCRAGASMRCAPLAGAWVGTLTPTTASRNAVDFARYGMTTSDLAGCIGMGVLGLAVIALIGLVKLSDCEDEDACTGTEPAA